MADNLLDALKDPTKFPDEFKSWLVDYVSINAKGILKSAILGLTQTLPFCQLHRTTQSINNNSSTGITDYEVILHDLTGMYSGSGTDVTITIPGVYLVVSEAHFASNATGVRSIETLINHTGTGYFLGGELVPAASGQPTQVNATMMYSLAATDTVEMVVYQNSGGSLNVDGNLTVMKLVSGSL